MKLNISLDTTVHDAAFSFEHLITQFSEQKNADHFSYVNSGLFLGSIKTL